MHCLFGNLNLSFQFIFVGTVNISQINCFYEVVSCNNFFSEKMNLNQPEQTLAAMCYLGDNSLEHL